METILCRISRLASSVTNNLQVKFGLTRRIQVIGSFTLVKKMYMVLILCLVLVLRTIPVYISELKLVLFGVTARLQLAKISIMLGSNLAEMFRDGNSVLV